MEISIKNYPPACINNKNGSINVHFTNICDNKCFYCVDALYKKPDKRYPDIDTIYDSILKVNDSGSYDNVLFLGGEPLLFLELLLHLVKKIKKNTNLKVYTTTSIPAACINNKDNFLELINTLDGINFSMQCMDEKIANEIRGKKSYFNKNEFIKRIPSELKKKIRINLNMLKPYLCTKEDIVNNINYYKDFNEIKLSELQHRNEHFVSFSDLFDVEFKPAFGKCIINISINGVDVLLKRSCFMCCDINPKPKEIFDISKEMLKQKIGLRKNKDKFIYNDRIENSWIKF